MILKKLNAGSRGVKFLTTLGLLVCSNITFADNQASQVPLSSGVLVDIANERVFTLRPKKGIDAVDVRTGKSLWTSTEADMPVSVNDSVLLAQVDATKPGILEMAYLDAETGDYLKSASISIADDAWARVSHSMDAKFSLTGASISEPARLHWQHVSKQVRGADLVRDEIAAKETSGFLQADFSKRSLSLATEPPAFKSSVDYRASIPANAPGRRALYSVDRQHVATSTILSPEERANFEPGSRYQWHVYTSDGEKLRSFASAVSFAPFVVVGDRLLYVTPPAKRASGDTVQVTPLSLRAIDLGSGEEAFKTAVKDVRFVGPFPP